MAVESRLIVLTGEAMGLQGLMSIVEKVEKFAKEHLAAYCDPSHDWCHVERVRRMALHIASQEMLCKPSVPIDLEVVEIGALLHDVGDFKHCKEGESGAEIIRSFLHSLDYPQDRIDLVLKVVGGISFRKEIELKEKGIPLCSLIEAACVQDADRLDAIGAIGIARAMVYGGVRTLPIYDPSVLPEAELSSDFYNQQTRKNTGSSLNHFYEKLFKLAAMIKTKSAKEEAVRRHGFMVKFVRELEFECALSPLPIP